MPQHEDYPFNFRDSRVFSGAYFCSPHDGLSVVVHPPRYGRKTYDVGVLVSNADGYVNMFYCDTLLHVQAVIYEIIKLYPPVTITKEHVDERTDAHDHADHAGRRVA